MEAMPSCPIQPGQCRQKPAAGNTVRGCCNYSYQVGSVIIMVRGVIIKVGGVIITVRGCYN